MGALHPHEIPPKGYLAQTSNRICKTKRHFNITWYLKHCMETTRMSLYVNSGFLCLVNPFKN